MVGAMALLFASGVPAAATAQAPVSHAEHQSPAAQPDSDAAPHQGGTPAASGDRAPLPPNIPPLTDADRQAAFPDVHDHAMHGGGTHGYVLFDQFEGRAGSGARVFSWDTKGWIGSDRNRFWFRTESDRVGDQWEQAQHNLLYGRAISPWWDVIAGVRVDTLPGTPRTALAIGVQGLAPGRTEVELSTYIERSGRTHVRLESEYELLITNRLVFQPLLEFEVYGSADPERHLGRGLTTGEFGIRARYEVRREFAPYVGVVWTRKFFGTRDVAAAAGGRTASARLAAGVRFWM
jgi:copper resistance protein B